MSGRRQSYWKDPQSSPKIYRRDGDGFSGKQFTTCFANVHNGSASLHNKPNYPPKHPTQQHDERGSAGHAGRNSGQRKAGERGWWKDPKSQLNKRAEASHGREQRDEKSQAELDDNTFQRRDGFSKRRDGPRPTPRKRPAFREKKVLVDSGDTDPAAAAVVKSSQIDHPPQRNDRKEERSSNPRHLDRPEKHFADDTAPNKGEAKRDGFPSRGRRYGGNDSYRGRQKFNGRQDYCPGNTHN